MPTTRDWARRVMRAIRIPAPIRGDTTLHLTGVPDAWPALLAARYGVRAALDLGHAKIAVHRVSGSPVVFDVVDVVAGVARSVGHWPQPPLRRPGLVRGLAITAFRGLGAEVAPRHGWVSGATLVVKPPESVSGMAGGREG